MSMDVEPPKDAEELNARLRELEVAWRRMFVENEKIYGQRNPVSMTFHYCAEALGDAIRGNTWRPFSWEPVRSEKNEAIVP